MSSAISKADASSMRGAYNPLLHKVACFVMAWAFLVICLGGKTKSKEAGLTIAEPVTFAWEPAWLNTENISSEYSHRIVAFVLSCSILGLMFLVLKRESRVGVRKLAVALFGAVVAQAVLGALTVKFLAQAASSIPHAVLAQITFALAASMVVVTSASWMSNEKPRISNDSPALPRLARALVIAMFIQLLLGAAIRHDDKGSSLRNGHEYIFITHLMAHILGAVAVTYFLGRVLMRVFRQHRDQKAIMNPARWMMMLLGLQLTLGIGAAILKFMYHSYDAANSPPTIRVIVATSHVATGALMMALSVAIALNARRFTANGTSEFEQASSNAVGATA